MSGTPKSKLQIKDGQLYEVGEWRRDRVQNIELPNGEKFNFTEKLGHGSFGVVYKAMATDENGFRYVCALKCSKIHLEDFVEIREVHMMNVLRNSTIDKTNILISDSDNIHREFLFQPFRLMQISLMDLLKTELDSMTLPIIRVILKQLFFALSQLEIIGFIHGDIKTNNIMIVCQRNNPWYLKLIDFGMSMHGTFRRGAPQHFHLQALGYKAPEIMFLHRDFFKIDIFSLGCIMLDLLTKCTFFSPHHNCQKHVMFYIYQLIGDVPQSCEPFCLYWFFVKDGKVPKPTSENSQVDWRTEYCPVTFDRLRQWCIGEEMVVEDIDQALDLVRHIITWHPQDRYTGSEALAHPFITMSHLANDTEYYNQNVMVMRQARAYDV